MNASVAFERRPAFSAGPRMTRPEFPRVVWEFVIATNARDLRWLETLFSERCTISACGFAADGLGAVSRWMEEEIIAPSIWLVLDAVSFDGQVTSLRVRAADHGLVHESEFIFRTAGRHIESLTIAALPFHSS
ncbi:hypothetical protein BH11ACT3_BH11ACT3_12870 [soil metagenome]